MDTHPPLTVQTMLLVHFPLWVLCKCGNHFWAVSEKLVNFIKWQRGMSECMFACQIVKYYIYQHVIFPHKTLIFSTLPAIVCFLKEKHLLERCSFRPYFLIKQNHYNLMLKNVWWYYHGGPCMKGQFRNVMEVFFLLMTIS